MNAVMLEDVSAIHHAARVKRASAVLYLDFDGVLHSDQVYVHPRRGIYIDQAKAPGRKLFEWTHHLEAALVKAPNVKVVLSTSWVRHQGFDRAKKWLPERLAERVIGGTYHNRVHGADPWMQHDFATMARGLQVWGDVNRRMPRDWCALDDDTLDWPARCHDKLIACDGGLGLSAPEVRDALDRQLARLQAVCDEQRER